MNTEKLTLEHLAPYLPYGLKGMAEYLKIGFKKAELIGFSRFALLVDRGEGVDEYCHIEDFKPLLIPLSELNKNFCLNNGESITNYISVKQMERIRNIGTNISEQNLFSIDYGHVVGLFKLHFDVFNLINKGLALNKLNHD